MFGILSQDAASLFGFGAAALTTVSFVPQVLHTLKTRDTKGISLHMYVLFCIGILLWLIYGVMTNDLPVTAANFVTLIFASTVLALKIKNG
ncbi:MAG: SemiSWEET transporter [Candidatus Micrarchaeota archaeon]